MSIFKKKLVAVIALLCACLCFTVLGFSLTAKPEQASAAGSQLTTVDDVGIARISVEDRTFYAFNSTSGGAHISTGNFEKATYNSYPTAKSISDDAEHSYSDYSGNYSISSDYNSITKPAQGTHVHGFMFNNVTNVDHANSLLSLRTKYLGGDIYLRGMSSNFATARTTKAGGYYFTLTANGYSLTKDAVDNGTTQTTIVSLTNYNNSIELKENDNLIVTYGNDRLSYETETKNNSTFYKSICDYYLKVVKVNDDYTLTTLVDLGVSDTTNRIVSDVQLYGTYSNINKNISSPVDVPLFIGGVEKPIGAVKPTTTTPVSVAGAVGDTLANVSLPLGYAFNDKTATIASGTNTVAGTQATYYEKTSSVNISVVGYSNNDENDLAAIKVGDEAKVFWAYYSSGTTIAQANFNNDDGDEYVSNKTSDEDPQYSYSDYVGNYSLTRKNPASEVKHVHGFTFADGNDYNNSIVSFRTKYLNGDILLRGLTPKKFYARTTVSGGYYFTLSSNGFSLTADGGVAGLSPRTILSLTAYNNSAILEENDNLIVTFGEDRLCYEQGSTDLGYGQKCVCDYYLKVVRVEDNGDHTILVDRGVGNTNKIVSSVVVATRTEE